jgi:hypothetical protein
MTLAREWMRGAAPLAVLTLLERDEMYGYQLVEALEKDSGGLLAMGSVDRVSAALQPQGSRPREGSAPFVAHRQTEKVLPADGRRPPLARGPAVAVEDAGRRRAEAVL